MSNSTISSTELSSTTSEPLTTSTSVESTSSRSTSSAAAVTTSSSEVRTSSSAASTSFSSTTTFTPTSEPRSTSTFTASSQPPTTVVSTITPTAADGSTQSPVTVVVTQTQSESSAPTTPHSSSGASSTTSGTPALNTGTSDRKSGGGGLSTAGTTAVAVVVPVVVIALLVVAGIFWWRKRKQRKANEDLRRKEVEDYGYNPNNDPTLPTVASENGAEMSEDQSGYRGWGVAGAASNRKMSTTLSGGHTQGQLSDSGSNSNGYRGGVSPVGGNSDGQSADGLMNQRRETMNSDEIGSLGQAPLASTNQAGVKRGPSNASSTYSAGNHSDVSDGPPPPSSLPASYDPYNPNNGFGYSQHGPYGDGTYGGGNGPENGMPIVRDVSARRNTRIQQPGNYQQGNSGIAQNF